MSTSKSGILLSDYFEDWGCRMLKTDVVCDVVVMHEVGARKLVNFETSKIIATGPYYE